LKVRTGGPTDGPFGGVELPDVVSDRNGRYIIRDVTAPILFVETAPGSEHRFLCRYYPIVGMMARFGPGPFLDLPVVHVTWAGDGVPPGMWVVGTSVSGRVLERQGETLQPIAEATVMLDGGGQDPPATTNAAGFFMVCSVVGTDQYRMISAEKPGYRTVTRQIFGGWDYFVDLELTPN
jgi:hypothetical protein